MSKALNREINTGIDVKNLEAFKKNVINAAIKTPRSRFKPILKFAKHGQWILGKDKDEVTLGERVAIRAPSMLEGWIGWQNGKVVAEKMAPIGSQDIKLDDLEPIAPVNRADGWYRQVSFDARFIEADDQLEVNYKASSDGGRDSFYELVHKIAIQFDVDENFINPVVKLSRSSYQHKEYGLIYKPQFEVVDWMSLHSTELYSKAQHTALLDELL
jgi:hypothetical protein